MSHVRQTVVRDPVAAALKAGVPSVDGNVHTNRAHAPAPGETPCIYVFTPEEAPSLAGERQQRPMRRDVTVNVLVYANTDGETVDDELDGIAAEIEVALFDYRAVHPALEALAYRGMSVVVVQGELQNGVMQHAFIATVFTRPGQPGVTVQG